MHPGAEKARLVPIALLLCAGCGVGAKQAVIAETLDQPHERQENFEAVLRVLDEHPQYVDEFFALARKHEPTLDRFIANAAQNLDDEELARMTARHLAANPEGLRQILVSTLRAAEDRPGARQAIAGAIGDEVEIATDILTDDPEVVRQTLLATVRHVIQKPEPRRAFVDAMYGASPTLARILAHNSNVLTRMFELLAEELADDPKLLAELAAELAPE